MRTTRFILLLAAAGAVIAAGGQRPRIPYISDASRQALWYNPPGFPVTGCFSFTYGPRGVDRETWQKEAFACRDRLLEAARKAADLEAQMAALGELGFGFKALDRARAVRQTEEALALADRLGEQCWASALFRQHGLLYGANISTLGSFRLAVAAARQGSCPAELALGLMLYGNHLPKEDRSAVQHLKEAVHHARLSGENEVLKRVLTQLAHGQVSLGDNRAILHLEEVVSLHRAIGDRRRELNATWNVGVAHVLLGRPTAGIAYLEKYLDHQEASGHPDDWAQKNLDRLRETGSF